MYVKFPERATTNGTENGEHSPMNGEGTTSPPEDVETVKKCDIIQITGNIEQVEKAKEALLVSKY